MDHLVKLLFLNLLCCCCSMSATFLPPAATSLQYHSMWKPHPHSHSHSHHHRAIYAHDHMYDRMPAGFTSLHHHSHDSERMVDSELAGDFRRLSSMGAHDYENEKRDLDALLSFRKGIASDAWGKLSNWTAKNSESICSSWYGIRCRPHTRRVVAIDLEEDWGTSTSGISSNFLTKFEGWDFIMGMSEEINPGRLRCLRLGREGNALQEMHS